MTFEKYLTEIEHMYNMFDAFRGISIEQLPPHVLARIICNYEGIALVKVSGIRLSDVETACISMENEIEISSYLLTDEFYKQFRPDYATGNSFMLFVACTNGLIVHETGHKKYASFEAFKHCKERADSTRHQIYHKLFNIIEDIYLNERVVREEAVVCATSVNFLRHFIFDKDVEESETKEEELFKQIKYLMQYNVPSRRAEVAQVFDSFVIREGLRKLVSGDKKYDVATVRGELEREIVEELLKELEKTCNEMGITPDALSNSKISEMPELYDPAGVIGAFKRGGGERLTQQVNNIVEETLLSASKNYIPFARRLERGVSVEVLSANNSTIEHYDARYEQMTRALLVRYWQRADTYSAFTGKLEKRHLHRVDVGNVFKRRSENLTHVRPFIFVLFDVSGSMTSLQKQAEQEYLKLVNVFRNARIDSVMYAYHASGGSVLYPLSTSGRGYIPELRASGEIIRSFPLAGGSTPCPDAIEFCLNRYQVEKNKVFFIVTDGEPNSSLSGMTPSARVKYLIETNKDTKFFAFTLNESSYESSCKVYGEANTIDVFNISQLTEKLAKALLQ